MADRSDRPPVSLVQSMERQRQAERISPMVRPQTHHPECWRDPAHHACAVREVERLRAAMVKLFPAEEGFTEAMDDLIDMGLLVEVPADQQFRDEWGGDTMYAWAWSKLALERVEEGGE